MLKSKKIGFADRTYLVYRDGSIWSDYSGTYLKPKVISPKNPRLIIDVKVKGTKRGLLVNRLVYFLFKYSPIILGKDCGTFKEFWDMPFVAHKDGNIMDNSVGNLVPLLSHKELAIWVLNNFPDKCKVVTRQLCINGKDETLCKKLLKTGHSYSYIGEVFGVSDMAVFRFAKRHDLVGDRQNGTPKLTDGQVRYIRSSEKSGKELAVKYNVTTSAISRVRKNKTYQSVQ